MDIIDISDDLNLDSNWGSKSSGSNFGLELLMNDKSAASRAPTSDIDIDDLNNLEAELNDLANETAPMTNSYESGLFGLKTDFDDKPSVRFDDKPSVFSGGSGSLGQSTASQGGDSKTWDGYGKFNNIPINPDAHMSSKPRLSKDEELREKFKYLRKLEDLERKGVELTKKYNMDSDLQEMQGEYEMIQEERAKQNSVKFQGNMMKAVISGIEFLNNRFDPFDVKLDGWGDQVNENINDYDDIFAELYEKYKSKANIAPELKLLFQLGGSAMMVHMSNTLFKSAMPNIDDIMRQNPDLARQFQQAAVNSMATSSPGLSGFMNGVLNAEPSVPRGRGPPPPMQTQGPGAPPPPSNRGGNNVGNMNVRPDVSMARGVFADDGISFRESNLGVPGFEPPQPNVKSSRRPDMKGPSDIESLLGGMKTKTINIPSAPQQQRQNYEQQQPTFTNIQTLDTNNNSTISIEDLKSIQSDDMKPKRTRRKPKSDKNASVSLGDTISLDL